MQKIGQKVGIFSFFAGAGFLDLGFDNTDGFESVFVNEFHSPFLEIYKHSRNILRIPEPRFGYHDSDITNLLKSQAAILDDSLQAARQLYDLIGFIGGPPCPDFSVGGKNKGSKGENGKLSGTYVDLIVKSKPDFFLFENVKGLYRTKKHREFFDKLKRKLKRNGYAISEKLINSLEYGVPQDRERIILIGFRSDLSNHQLINKRQSKSLNFNWEVSTSYSMDALTKIDWPTQEIFIIDSKKDCPENVIEELTVEHWFRKNNVSNHPNSSHYFKPRAGLAKFQTIDEGDDLKKSYKRLHRWRYSPTAAYGNNEVHLHPYKARRISVSEALAIQSLPSNFELPSNVSLSNMFKTIGNGVPYLAAIGLAESIKFHIESTLITENTNEKVNSGESSFVHQSA